MKLFPNRDQECFGCSLANYFSLNDQLDLAEKVYDEFRRGHFVTSNGTLGNSLLSTRVVHDLTDGQYQGFLQHTSYDEDQVTKILRQHIPLSVNSALKVIEEEKRAFRFLECQKSFSYITPAIIFYNVDETRQAGHAVVVSSKKTIIDNGKIVKISDAHFLEPFAVLEISKRSIL